jgi:hypothetical protein
MNFSEAVVLALIALVSSTIAIIWKMYSAHTNLAASVLEVVKENTVATQKQVNSTDKQIEASKQVAANLSANTKSLNEQSNVLSQHQEVLAGLALKALRPRTRKTDIIKPTTKKKKTKK